MRNALHWSVGEDGAGFFQGSGARGPSPSANRETRHDHPDRTLRPRLALCQPHPRRPPAQIPGLVGQKVAAGRRADHVFVPAVAVTAPSPAGSCPAPFLGNFAPHPKVFCGSRPHPSSRFRQETREFPVFSLLNREIPGREQCPSHCVALAPRTDHASRADNIEAQAQSRVISRQSLHPISLLRILC